jgi:hypothetical protein
MTLAPSFKSNKACRLSFCVQIHLCSKATRLNLLSARAGLSAIAAELSAMMVRCEKECEAIHIVGSPSRSSEQSFHRVPGGAFIFDMLRGDRAFASALLG